jgi:hypothetical protein
VRMLRYEVPVDDRWHTIELGGDPLHIAARNPSIVEFWTLADTGAEVRPRSFRVFGTGQPLDRSARVYRGTVLTFGGQLVWHLFEAASGRAVDDTPEGK